MDKETIAQVIRNVTVDIAKGLGILLVVAGHLIGATGGQSVELDFLKSFLYQFHIPLFFFLSGLFFKPQEGWWEFLVKKFSRLYLPFMIANTVFLALDICLRLIAGVAIVPLNELKHFVKIVLGISLAPMGGATWFLIALLRAVIIYKLLYSLFKGNRIWVILACVAIGLTGTFVTSKYSTSASMVAVMFFCAGHMMKGVIHKLPSARVWLKAVALMACFAILIAVRPYNKIDVSSAEYQNRLLALLGSVSGICMTILLSDLISRIKRLSCALTYVGRQTMSVLVGHFAAFKLVVIIQVILSGTTVFAILSHPCYDVSGWWSLLYFAAGVALPLLCISIVKSRG